MVNYKDWINNIDVKVDYFSAFLKAYIAFNSWYKEQYPQSTDRAAIDTIKDSDNVFRRYIMNFFSSTSNDESIMFQNCFGSLHKALCTAVVTTQEFGGVRKQISFSDIAIKNISSRAAHSYRRIEYIVKRERGGYVTEIKNNCGTSILTEFQEKYSFDELETRPSFQLLSDERKMQAKVCYDKMQPYFSKSILFHAEERGDNDENVLMISSYAFINDNLLLSKAIIEIVYLLRCSLAHGDVSPDNNANNVYRYAYELLAMTLKKMV